MLNEIKINKLEKSIFYLESVFNNEKKMDIYKKADGFILPSKSENFGISIGEALSCACLCLHLKHHGKLLINIMLDIFLIFQKEIQLNLDKFMSLSDEERYRMGMRTFNLIKESLNLKKYLTYMRTYTQA